MRVCSTDTMDIARHRWKWVGLLFFICIHFTRAESFAVVPSPNQQIVDVIVSGRTSTLRRVDVAAIGQQIPETFSGKSVGNTSGFSWYVSRHYALKTNYDAAKSKFYLQLLEMAYPHYVALFGREPPGIEQK